MQTNLVLQISIPLKTAVPDLQACVERFRRWWLWMDMAATMGASIALLDFGMTPYVISAVISYAVLRYDGRNKIEAANSVANFYQTGGVPVISVDEKGIMFPVVVFPTSSKISRFLIRSNKPALMLT